ncbi:ECF transporter S component [Clostridium sp. MB40-C1]|uniref:ECF transporter S component n=1 Tax=Clostridium sp. MB40-C1 TaxID=3070996 RepID=UPI0027E0214D|nr:ECF transporter S component [Clostridium sp. MB40-C1]WMJ80882.1 ECF transporter S component [Clostridium sp. MB40-C1]
MRKISIGVAISTLIILVVFSVKFANSKNLGILITLGVVLTLFFSYFYFEKSSMGTKEIALIATLGSFAAVCRVPFAIIPNVQPTTFLVAISGLVFGSYEGFLVGSLAAFISNIFLGQGPWTPWQMMAWGIVGAISGLIGKTNKKISSEKFSVICFAYGILFGWITNLWFIVSGLKIINIKTIIAANLTSLTLDIMHAGGNFIFCIIFFDNIYKVLFRFKQKLEITYLE